MTDLDRACDLVTVREAAKLLRQSDVSIRRKVRNGELRAYRVGDHVGPLRLERAEVMRHLVPTGADPSETA